jgi:hypothetical protein
MQHGEVELLAILVEHVGAKPPGVEELPACCR